MFDLFCFIREGIQFPEVQEELDKHRWQIYLVLQLLWECFKQMEVPTALPGMAPRKEGGRRKSPFFTAKVDEHADADTTQAEEVSEVSTKPP